LLHEGKHINSIDHLLKNLKYIAPGDGNSLICIEDRFQCTDFSYNEEIICANKTIKVMEFLIHCKECGFTKIDKENVTDLYLKSLEQRVEFLTKNKHLFLQLSKLNTFKEENRLMDYYGEMLNLAESSIECIQLRHHEYWRIYLVWNEEHEKKVGVGNNL